MQPEINPDITFGLSEEQRLLADTARQYLADKAGSDTVRTLMESEAGFDPQQWLEIAEMGWLGIAVPEEYGGAGYTFVELAVLLELLGASLLPTPFFSTVVLGIETVLEVGSERQKKELLPKVVGGDIRLTLAAATPEGAWNGGSVSATPDGDGVRLTGSSKYVLDGHTADRLLVASLNDAGDMVVTIVEAGAEGVQIERLDTMDLTRPLAQVSFDGVVGEPLSDEEDDAAAIQRVMDRAVIALAAEQVGGAQTVLDMSVEYAKTRVQFGRPIGSFQAIKHKCADMLVEVESARSAAEYAARTVVSNPEELALVAPLVKSYCSEAYFHAAAENIQIHGGIGFTWEHDAHLYFKRAKSSELMFGTPAEHRVRLADHLGL